MKKLKQDHSPKWYFFYSIFAALIVIGVFTILNDYTNSIQDNMEYTQKLGEITINTIEDFENPSSLFPEPPQHNFNIIKPILLIITGIVGFLFTKFVYETQRRGRKW